MTVEKTASDNSLRTSLIVYSSHMHVMYFDALVKPIICYGSEVWGSLNNLQSSKSIDVFWKRLEALPAEKFQIKFCKYVLGVHNKSTNSAVMGELGRYPIIISVVNSMIRYCQHIDEMKNRMPLLAAAAIEDSKLKVSKSWRGNLDNILKLFGLSLKSGLTWEKLANRMTYIMKEKFERHWKSSLGDQSNDNGKLYLFRRIKNSFRMEPYLNQIKKTKFRRAMTMMRISAHKLEIETGRYAIRRNQITKRDERFCMLCQQNNVNVVGDAYHALMVCPTFHDERVKLLDSITKMYPNFMTLSNCDKMFFYANL